MTHGSELRRLREEAGVSLTTMFKQTGMHTSYLSDVELGKRPRLEGDKLRQYLAAIKASEEFDRVSILPQGETIGERTVPKRLVFNYIGPVRFTVEPIEMDDPTDGA